jgi:hypothetical protein
MKRLKFWFYVFYYIFAALKQFCDSAGEIIALFMNYDDE